MAVRVKNAVTQESWQDFMRGVYEGSTFHNYISVFGGPHAFEIAPRLKEILEEFGEQGRAAQFAIHNGAIVGFWADPHHNYIAIRFSRASGDDFDGFTVNSIG